MLRYLRALTLAATAATALLAVSPASAELRDPLPRLADRICPGVIGLSVEQAELLVGRMRANAEDLGIVQADPEVCEPNIIVAIVPDGQAYLQQLEENKPYAFQELTPTARRKLLASPGPAHAFLRTATRNRDGLPVFRRENLVQIPLLQAHAAHSKIYTAARVDITHALVLFDAPALKGKTVAQLADLATMLALLHEVPEPSEASILHLFDETGDKPTGLTTYDRTYLQTMYSGLPNIPSDVRMAEVDNRIQREEAAQAER